MGKNNFQKEISKIAAIDHPIVKDLIALIWSEEVYQAEFSDTFYFLQKKQSLSDLIEWSKNIEIDTNFSKLNKLPLGKYAESLLNIYFKNCKEFELLANNIQLIKENKTIGEIDFLLKDLIKEEYIHLEFALKYYLKVKWNGQLTFLGPNVNDQLRKKKEKLLGQQSRLLNRHQNLLDADFQKINFQPKIWMKGVRFYPFNISEKYSHTKAWWLNFEDIDKLQKRDTFFEVVSQKKDWIFPYFREKEVDFNSLKTKAEHYFQQKKNALMVVRKESNKVIDRGFIMRKKWPN